MGNIMRVTLEFLGNLAIGATLVALLWVAWALFLGNRSKDAELGAATETRHPFSKNTTRIALVLLAMAIASLAILYISIPNTK